MIQGILPCSGSTGIQVCMFFFLLKWLLYVNVCWYAIFFFCVFYFYCDMDHMGLKKINNNNNIIFIYTLLFNTHYIYIIYIYIHTHTHTYIYTCMYVCIYIYMCVIIVYINIYKYIHTHTHTHIIYSLISYKILTWKSKLNSLKILGLYPL